MEPESIFASGIQLDKKGMGQRPALLNKNYASIFLCRFHALGPIYYRSSNGAILVYDITDEDSFKKV